MQVYSSLAYSVGESSLRSLVDIFAHRGALTRDQLVEETGWARSTVSRAITTLIDSDFLVEHPAAPSGGRGRPSMAVALNPSFGVAVGLDFGYRHVRGVLADASHRVRSRVERTLPVDYTPEQGLAGARAVLDELMAESNVEHRHVLGVAAAIPAPVDLASGAVSVSSMLPTWDGVDVRGRLSDAMGSDVAIDNDSKMAAYGELRWGSARNLRDFLYFKLHSGVGGAAVVNGELVHGHTGAAGHFGHISVELQGEICRCGSRGCLEVFAGIPAILEAITSVHGRISLQDFFALLTNGDPACVRVFHDAALRVGQVAGMMCNALNPEAVMIGGALSSAFDLLTPHVRAGLVSNAQSANHNVAFLRGSLGHHASAMGALGIALNTGVVRALS